MSILNCPLKKNCHGLENQVSLVRIIAFLNLPNTGIENFLY